LLATARGELAAPLFRSARLRQNGFSPGLRRERCWILSRTSCWWWRDSLSQSNERLARKVKCSSSIVWWTFRDDRYRHDAEGVTRRVSPRQVMRPLRECKSRPAVRGWCLDTAVLFRSTDHTDLPDDGQISSFFVERGFARSAFRRENCVREKTEFVRRFKLIWVVQMSRKKYFRFAATPNHGHHLRCPAPTRGASRSSRT